MKPRSLTSIQDIDLPDPAALNSTTPSPIPHVEDDPYSDTMDASPLTDTDPDSELTDLRNAARHHASDMMPTLLEKFRNAPAKESLAIWEALADRGLFTKPVQSSGSTMNVLNIGADDALNVLSGISKALKGPTND